jgi:hypothetical protein
VDFAWHFVGAPLACVGRGADPAPGIGPGAGRLMAGSIEQPESDESNSLALRLPTVARGAVCRRAGASSFGTVGRSPDPFALASPRPLFSVALGVCPALTASVQLRAASLGGP